MYRFYYTENLNKGGFFNWIRCDNNSLSDHWQKADGVFLLQTLVFASVRQACFPSTPLKLGKLSSG